MLKEAVIGAALALGGAGMAEPLEAAPPQPSFSFRIELGDVSFGYSTGPVHGPIHMGPMYQHHHHFRHGNPGFYVVPPRMPYMPEFRGPPGVRFGMPQYNPPHGPQHRGPRGPQHRGRR